MPDSGSGTGTAITCAVAPGGSSYAVCDVCTLLPLEHYARLMAIHPDAFNQCYIPGAPYPGECERVWIQYGWMDNVTGRIIGRCDVAQAIATAEEMIAHAAGFWPAPKWEQGEEHQWPLPARGAQWQYPPIRSTWGHIIEPGQRALTIIDEDACIAYSDEDGDGVLDTGTISITAAQMTAANALREEVAVFLTDETTCEYQIRDLHITENTVTGDVTITGRRSQFVDRNRWEVADPVDLTNNANFLGAVDVYRLYNDPSEPAQVVWKGGVLSCDTTLCADACQDACVSVDDTRRGLVRVIPGTYSAGTWSVASFSVNRLPDRARLWYYHGLLLQPDLRIKPSLAEAITRLANTYLVSEPCGCDMTRYRWERDRQEAEVNSYDAAQAMSNFGTTMLGAVAAWSVVKRLQPIANGAALT